MLYSLNASGHSFLFFFFSSSSKYTKILDVSVLSVLVRSLLIANVIKGEQREDYVLIKLFLSSDFNRKMTTDLLFTEPFSSG